MIKLFARIAIALLTVLPLSAAAWNSPGHFYNVFGRVPVADARVVANMRFVVPVNSFVNERFHKAPSSHGLKAAAGKPANDRQSKSGSRSASVACNTLAKLARTVCRHGHLSQPLWGVPAPGTMALRQHAVQTRWAACTHSGEAGRYSKHTHGTRGNRRIVTTDPDPQKKAIALAWLFHLVGDVHQPLHTSQLFSIDYPDGDQGGNQICIRTRPGSEPVNLHRFWDAIITRSDRLPVLEKLATFLRTRQEFAKPQLTELATTDFEGWVKESFQAAIAVAYAGGTLRRARKNQKQDCREVAAAPVLPVDYIATARRVADRRMILAGYRLAELLARAS